MTQTPQGEPLALMRRCVGATDRCYLGGPCPYCEALWPLRYEDGTFAPYPKPTEQTEEARP